MALLGVVTGPVLTRHADRLAAPWPAVAWWGLTACLPALLAPAATQRPYGQLEGHPWRLRCARSAWATALLIALMLAALVSMPTGAGEQLLLAPRNVALLGGLSLLTARVIPTAYAALPGLAWWLACMTWGRRSDIELAPWALLLRPADDPLAGIAALAVACVAVAVYAAWDAAP